MTVYGADRARIQAKLAAIGIRARTSSYKTKGRKFLLWCSNVTEEELQALELHLELGNRLRRDRRASYGGDCSGGNNGFEIIDME